MLSKFSDTAKSMDEETYEKWIEEKKTFAEILKTNKKTKEVKEEKQVKASEEPTENPVKDLDDVEVEVNPNLTGSTSEVEEDIEDQGMDEAVAGICGITQKEDN